MHFRIKVFPIKQIEPDDKISTVLAYENIEEIWCRKGRIVYKEEPEREKSYKTKYGLTCSQESDVECPDYDPDVL